MTNARQLDVDFPAVRAFSATKTGDDSTYHYTVVRTSEQSAWKIQRAWRTACDGTLAEEYAVP
jgi:hypothetical protein